MDRHNYVYQPIKDKIKSNDNNNYQSYQSYQSNQSYNTSNSPQAPQDPDKFIKENKSKYQM